MNARIQIYKNPNIQESKYTPSQNIGEWDRMITSSNSIQWIHNCNLPSNATMSGTHLKHLTFSMHGDGSLDHTYKNSPRNVYFAIHSMSWNRSAKLWFCFFNKAQVSLRELLSPASFHMIVNGCSNETNATVLCPCHVTQSNKLTNAQGTALIWLTAD